MTANRRARTPARPALRALGRTSGVFLVLLLVFASYEGFFRPWMRNWGTRRDESTRALFGDDLIASVAHQETRAVGINAPAATVWGWVAQLGQDRGGFYSFRMLENVFGSEMPDVRAQDPPLQRWSVGDRLWMHPKAFIPLRAIDPGRALAFEGKAAFGEAHGSWTLVVVPEGENRTRLLVRDRASTGLSTGQAFLSRAVFEPMHFVMERRMLRGIQALSEGRDISTLGNTVQPILWVLTGCSGIAATVIVLRGRRTRWGLATLFASGLLFQVLTFMQPHPVLGAVLVLGLITALFVRSPFLGDRTGGRVDPGSPTLVRALGHHTLGAEHLGAEHLGGHAP